jgi:hypothetical protein
VALPALSQTARRYLTAFPRIAAIALTRDGRLVISRNPAGAERAWWLHEERAGELLRLAGANGRDVPAAAAQLGIQLTDHATVVQRATASVARLSAQTDRAQLRGDLTAFNREYRRRRLAAAAAGRKFIAYRTARARLEAAALAAATSGEPMSWERIFERE